MEKDRYAMSENLATTTHHPGYSAKISPEENVRKGYEKSHNYAHVASELRELANIQEHMAPHASAIFRRAEHIAHDRAVQYREYEYTCPACKKHHSAR